MKVYYATHSTTTDNEAAIASGWNDVELSVVGKRQAEEVRRRFDSVPLDLVCVSDLGRAVDTARIAFDGARSVLVDARLREINYGDLNGAPRSEVDKLRIPSIYKPFPGGESYEEAIARTADFYRELLREDPDRMVLVIGHGVTHLTLRRLTSCRPIRELLEEPFVWQPVWEYDL
jgi:broad specificity phosphatase PhoE